jgi:hypothetical protein
MGCPGGSIVFWGGGGGVEGAGRGLRLGSGGGSGPGALGPYYLVIFFLYTLLGF